MRLRYFDVRRRCPGLPEDVGVLVEKLEAGRTVELPPGSEITLDMATEHFANEPSYSSPR